MNYYFKDKLLIARDNLLKRDYKEFEANLIYYNYIDENDELKSLCYKYIIDHKINLEGLNEDQLTTINVDGKYKIIPKYMRNFEIFYTLPKKLSIGKEVITGKKYRTNMFNFHVHNLLKNLIIFNYEVNYLTSNEDYSELKNYLYNKEVIKDLISLISNYLKNKYNNYRIKEQIEIVEASIIEII